ncbi:MAG TPA: DNA/RNA nuclease SfsA [Candidatus Eubacterium avistercoris]|uniref:Sugar fermentation stimulation protein homolog n=1 Tax=Candidatus Eubacterium avistercoris TaxID=2838567 RepID=A0A9D2D1Y9_9FIRM|nr:DNA/RNA nuclease SfsA [Candidatus Eubacterium avistercoris]
MKYHNIIEGTFISRPNRFIANVEAAGQVQVCHVKNTGRCRELLVPGCRVYLETADNPNRKTKYDLIAVKKGNLLINMDSQAPNKAAGEWLEKRILYPDLKILKPEVKYDNSRFDFYIEAGERKIFLEVKGVTLEEGGIARFPDAPTERGVKHIRELMACMKEGYEPVILFVVQMKGIRRFMPNDETHKAFGDTLREAREKGVRILAYDCLVTEDSMEIRDPVPVVL